MVSLFLLGAPRLERDGQPVPITRRKVIALLAYLAVIQQPHTRDTLATLLWPKSDSKRAYGSLRRCLSLAKKAVGDRAMTITREMIGIKSDVDLCIDVVAFRRHLSAARSHDHAPNDLCSTCRDHLAQAADLYQGDFLVGFALPNAPEFDEWQFWQAEALRMDFVWVLEQLVTFHMAQSQPEGAISYARRRVTLDPLHEPAQQQLMQLYTEMGQHTAALRQYESFAERLAQELGVSPTTETAALAEQIRREARDKSSQTQNGDEETSPLGNLPTTATPFVGREQALGQIDQWLRQPNCRLITITGFGGVGKTRLALQAAAQQRHTFADGCYFVSLETAVSPTDLLSALSNTLPFTWRDDNPIKEQLFNALRPQQMLLLLDNFEQLTAADELLSELLAAAPGLKLLVTSRRRLGLYEEWLLPLSGLSFPADGDENPAAYQAVQLFLQQARRFKPGFNLSTANTPHVIRICQRVEGLPLGIELAAAWTRLLSCQEIAEKIARDQADLTTVCSNVPARHRSLQAVCDYSWQMLEAAGRKAARQLAVFRGGFTREAAQAVAGASLPLLLSLVDHSLLHCRAPECDQESGRFYMHPVIHQYAANRLSQRPDEERAAYARYCHYYAQFLQGREAALRGGR